MRFLILLSLILPLAAADPAVNDHGQAVAAEHKAPLNDQTEPESAKKAEKALAEFDRAAKIAAREHHDKGITTAQMLPSDKEVSRAQRAYLAAFKACCVDFFSPDERRALLPDSSPEAGNFRDGITAYPWGETTNPMDVNAPRKAARAYARFHHVAWLEELTKH